MADTKPIKIFQLQDSAGNDIYPKTTGQAISLNTGKILDTAISDINTSITSINTSVTDLTNDKADKSSLKTVATSGSYNDLSDKPSILIKSFSIQEKEYNTGSLTLDSISVGELCLVKYTGSNWEEHGDDIFMPGDTSKQYLIIPSENGAKISTIRGGSCLYSDTESDHTFLMLRLS